MHFPVSQIAINRFLPVSELIAYAESNADKFSIDDRTKGRPWISNFHVNDLVNAFKAENVELCSQVRAEKVAEIAVSNKERNE